MRDTTLLMWRPISSARRSISQRRSSIPPTTSRPARWRGRGRGRGRRPHGHGDRARYARLHRGESQHVPFRRVDMRLAGRCRVHLSARIHRVGPRTGRGVLHPAQRFKRHRLASGRGRPGARRGRAASGLSLRRRARLSRVSLPSRRVARRLAHVQGQSGAGAGRRGRIAASQRRGVRRHDRLQLVRPSAGPGWPRAGA